MSIPLGASGKDAELLINLFTPAGVAITGQVWTAGVYVCLPNGTYAAATGAQLARIVEKGRGRYALQLSGTETSNTGTVQLDLDATALGCLPHSQSEDIRDLATQTTASGIAAAAATAVWTTQLDFGSFPNVQNVAQFINVMAAVLFGQATITVTDALNGTVTYKNASGTVTRLVGAVVAGIRSITAADGR